MVFCFVQNFFFGQHKSQNFFFSHNLTLSYMTKTLNQIIFFFLHQNQNIFFSNIGNQNIFQVKWSFPKEQSSFFLQDLINIKNHSYNFRYTNTADIPTVRTTRYGLRSLRYSPPKIWNSLPYELMDTTKLNQIRTLINTWTEPSCSCIVCRSQGLSVCYGFFFLLCFLCIFSHNKLFLISQCLYLIFYFAYYLLPSLPHKFVCLVF